MVMRWGCVKLCAQAPVQLDIIVPPAPFHLLRYIAPYSLRIFEIIYLLN